MQDGSYWLLALKDNYNTENGDFMICPLDLIRKISLSEEKGCPLNEVKFIHKYDSDITNKRLKEYMKTNYDKPEEFYIKVRKNETSGNLILRTFGNDFTYEESTEEYDMIKVVRSPFEIINWALVNTRDVELIPTQESTKKRILEKIEEIKKIYKK